MLVPSNTLAVELRSIHSIFTPTTPGIQTPPVRGVLPTKIPAKANAELTTKLLHWNGTIVVLVVRKIPSRVGLPSALG